MKTVVFVLALLAILNAHEFSADSKVIQGKFETESKTKWRTEINELGSGFVLLYQTWCGHCKQLIPKFEESAANDESGVKYLAVDCGKASKFCQDLQVRGYPTLYYIKDYNNFYAYEGERDHESFQKFLKGGYSTAEKSNFTIFAEKKRLEEEEQKRKLDAFKAKAFHVNRDNYLDAFDTSKKSKFVFMYASFCGHCKAFLPVFENLMEKSVGKDFEMVAVEVQEGNGPIGSVFGLEGYPTMVFLKNDTWYKFDGKRDEDGVLEFIEFKHNDVLQAEVKDEKKPNFGNLGDAKATMTKKYKELIKQENGGYDIPDSFFPYLQYLEFRFMNSVSQSLQVSNKIATLMLIMTVFGGILIARYILLGSVLPEENQSQRKRRY